MLNRAFVVVLVGIVVGGASVAGQGRGEPLAQQGDLRIWQQFVSMMKDGTIGEAQLRPAYAPAPTVLGFLRTMREGATWPEWEQPPEIFRVGPRVHFVVKVSERGVPGTYSFTFLTEDGRWFLEHFESIVVRLDQVGTPPVSSFPDLPEQQKAWMRQETLWTQNVVLFRALRAAVGRDAALNAFRDGPGYLVAAKTWVPFFEPAKAFILYLCWEQSRLAGNSVTLERLGDRDASVLLDATYLRLYTQSSHMRQLLPENEYREFFESIWRDRATAAGWNVAFVYDGPHVTLRFTRKQAPA